MDTNSFQKGFTALCEWYGRKPIPVAVKVYYETLKTLSDDEFNEAIEWSIATQQFLPPPLTMLRAVGPNVEDLFNQILEVSQKLNQNHVSGGDHYLREKRILVSQLPKVCQEFISQTGISVLEIANLDTKISLPNAKRVFKSFIEKSSKGLKALSDTPTLPTLPEDIN